MSVYEISEEICLTCDFSDIWPTGEGLCDFHDKAIEGNDKACEDYAKRNFEEPEEMEFIN